ncbi:MAG TPA: class I SAM-dependent methyltransferase [Dehalococcoidia bacterium]|nr:class I SAM-dependent methyltransferase [Dehalococcoidia bacterium]
MTQQSDSSAIKEQQKQQWGRAAAGWRKHDERFRSVTAPVTSRLLELAAVGPGHHVLDIACGTGEPALPAAALAGPSGFVLATDMAAEMLEVARDKARAQGIANVEFRLADGEELDVEPATFDAATCRWGIMFMPEPQRCLRQAQRALRSGARMAVSVWGPPQRNPSLALPMGILRKYIQEPLPDPTAPGGVFSFADESRLASVFTEAGFRDVHIEGLEFPMAVFDSGYEYWQYTLDIAGPLATLVNRLPADIQQTVRQEVAAAVAGGDPQGPVSLNGYTLLCSAAK